MTSHRTVNIFILLLFISTAKGFIFQNRGTLSKSQIIDCLEDITRGKLRPECNVHFLKNDFSDENNEFKKALIKRIVPHGTSLRPIQIHNGIYKPLKRVPKIRKTNDFKAMIHDLIDSGAKPRKPFDFRAKLKPKKSKQRDLKDEIIKLLNKKLQYTEIPESHESNLIRKIRNLLHKRNKMRDINSIYGSKKPKSTLVDIKYILNRDLSKEFEDKAIRDDFLNSKVASMFFNQLALRQNLGTTTHFTKSGEDPHNEEGATFLDGTTEKPKKWIPHYPFYNYWTYEKSVYQDRCPGDLIEVDGMCMSYPPH